MKFPSSLRGGVHGLEDAIITLSGPGIALSGIIAGVDLLTGGHAMESVPWLTVSWAICLLLSLDFQVLALGARAHRVYLSDKSMGRKIAEIVLALVIAAAISYVSIQMQSIVAKMNASSLSIDQATTALGIDPNALIFERSILVLVLIFLSGWFRLEHADSSMVVQPIELEQWFNLVVQMNQGMLNQFFTEHHQFVVQLNQATLNQVDQLKEEFAARLNQVAQLNQGVHGRLNQLDQRVTELLELPQNTPHTDGLAQTQIDELLERLSQSQQGQIEAVFSRCIERVFVREDRSSNRVRALPAASSSGVQPAELPLNQQPAQDDHAPSLLNQLASGSSDGGSRVLNYLDQCKAAGSSEPSLTQIEQACQVAHNTAIAWRRQWREKQGLLVPAGK